MTTMAQTALHRTMRRAIMHVLADDERADMVLDSIMEKHPHLVEVWEKGTCRGCRAILSELERVEPHGCCEFCAWQSDHDYYVENLRMYGAE